MTMCSLDLFLCCTSLLAVLTFLVLWKIKQLSKVDNNHVTEPPRPKIVIDHGKALYQLVKFRVRFKKKLRRIRERNQTQQMDQVKLGNFG